MIYVGTDNGLTGALVAIEDYVGAILQKSVMPLQGKAKGNEVDCVAVRNFLDSLGGHEQITVILETPGKHSPGVQALCSMWDSYGAIRAILETRGIRHHRIAPQTWQKAMLGNVAKGQTKPAALSKARQLWPAEKWLKTPRCTTPHEGLIDAALIAEYGRIKNL
jgi:hypothetical protein